MRSVLSSINCVNTCVSHAKISLIRIIEACQLISINRHSQLNPNIYSEPPNPQRMNPTTSHCLTCPLHRPQVRSLSTAYVQCRHGKWHVQSELMKKSQNRARVIFRFQFPKFHNIVFFSLPQLHSARWSATRPASRRSARLSLSVAAAVLDSRS